MARDDSNTLRRNSHGARKLHEKDRSPSLLKSDSILFFLHFSSIIDTPIAPHLYKIRNYSNFLRSEGSR